MSDRDTIAAIATGMTDSGIGIIRISGSHAVDVGDGVFRLSNGRRILKEAASHVMHYGFAVEEENGFAVEKESDFAVDKKNDFAVEEGNSFIIDEVMAVVMRCPRSYTGEDTVEIQCHGGVLVMKKILDAVLKCGARMAEPGEFTKRAFLNGRIDLSEAEAVMDVIQSQNEYALSSSVSQLKGSLSRKVKELRSNILYEVAFIESALDDPEHISLEGYPERLLEKTEALAAEMKKLIDTAENGLLMKEGIRTVIVGKPNAGKSSLLNCLAGEERAIVTDVAGTTRDILTESVRLGDITLNLIDTAGIRNTEDRVEKIGVEKARKYASDADLVVYVADASVETDENDINVISIIKDKKVIVLLNKSDLESKVTEEEIKKLFALYSGKSKENTGEIPDSGNSDSPVIIRTSAKEGEGLAEFEKAVKEMFFREKIKSSNEIIITNLRHKAALQKAYDSLILVKKSIEEGMPEDFYSIDLMDAYASLGKIIGEDVDDDLVNEIFSKFCMGK